MLPLMARQGAVAVGFLQNTNLQHLYGHSEEEIVEEMKSRGESSASYSALKKFLNLRAGDLIAVKAYSSPLGKQPRLKIAGYAVVAERDGEIYRFGGFPLGHLINVEFIETDIEKTVPLGYGGTIHRLTNAKHLKTIFGAYYRTVSQRREERHGRRGTTRKSLRRITVKSRSYITGALHNEIQQSYFDYLRQRYPRGTVTMEKEFVDIRIEEPNRVTFIEVKPFITARQCIREAVGQLLEYSWAVQRDESKTLELVIVGPNRITPNERALLQHINQHAASQFRYVQWRP